MGATVLQGELDVGWGWYEVLDGGRIELQTSGLPRPKASDVYCRTLNDFASGLSAVSGIGLSRVFLFRPVGVTPHPSVPACWTVHGEFERRVWCRIVKNCDSSTAPLAHQAGLGKRGHGYCCG